MKARFLALVALVLGLASCQKDTAGFDVTVDGEVSTTVTVNLADATGTRAGGEADYNASSAESGLKNLGDGNYTIRYILQVFDQNGETSKDMVVKYSDESEVSFDVRLVPNRHYNFVAWADIVAVGTEGTEEYAYDPARDLHYTVVDRTLQKVTLKDAWNAMDETRDAYTGVYSTAKEGQEYTATSSINLTLTRPFAKLRVVTTDLAELFGDKKLPKTATVEYTTTHYNAFNALEGKVIGDSKNRNIKHEDYTIKSYDDNVQNQSMVLFTDYFFAKAEQEAIQFTLSVVDGNNNPMRTTYFNTDIPVKRNFLTTITGNVLTDGNEVNVDIDDNFAGDIEHNYDNDETTMEVNTAQDFAAALTNDDIDVVVLNGDINLNDLLTRAAYTALKINNGKTLTIDLNGNKLSANTYENSGNQELFLVKGTLTVKNGTIEYEHLGENMGWGSMTTIFDVTAGGVLNLEGVTAKNLGGSDMNFVAHLNNWGEVTLNVENCTLEATYVPVRVFNSGYDMNNVTIKNSTLKGVSAAFWVHNYTIEDFGTEDKAEAQKALLNFDIYNGTNTFSPDVNGLRYGFTNPIRTDAYGITKVVSEDGTEVTLGSFVENGLIRRGVAGAEENTTIKKVVVEEGVAVLYDRTFRRFYALEEVVLPSTLTTIGAAGSGVFQSCGNLKKIVIPESVTVLGKGSFQECTSLESINIPAGVTRIESDALRNTGLKSVEFHAGVTYFGAMAFRDCKQLTEVVINAPEFTMEGNTFGIMAAPYTPMTIYVANAEMKAYVESKLTAHAKTYITVKNPEMVYNTEDLKEAMIDNARVVIGANIEDATIKLPATLNNFTLRAAEGVVLKNTTISAADGNSYHYENLTFDGITFDNSRIVLTGWRNGEEVIKNLTVTNCVFENLYDDTNTAPVHINKDASEAVENFTFTNNVINGATGGSKSGVYAQLTGKVVFENNVINNVSFRPYVIQITTDDSIADTFTVKGNTFSGSSKGRAQGLGNNDAGTDVVNIVVSGNIFKGITEAQQICYWDFNPATTTADLSKNYYDIDIEANPSRIYYNSAASSVEDLKAMGVYPFYTALNADGTIDLNSLKQAE